MDKMEGDRFCCASFLIFHFTTLSYLGARENADVYTYNMRPSACGWQLGPFFMISRTTDAIREEVMKEVVEEYAAISLCRGCFVVVYSHLLLMRSCGSGIRYLFAARGVLLSVWGCSCFHYCPMKIAIASKVSLGANISELQEVANYYSVLQQVLYSQASHI